MLILPAIDLIDKKCVRLTKGVYSELSVYEEDPVKMAKSLVQGGAEYIHIIDLDSAIKGTKENFEVIEKIRNAVDVPIQLGGGIRSIERAIELIDIGIDRLIVSTAAIMDDEFLTQLIEKFKNRIAISLDAKGEIVLIKGWVEKTDKNIYELAKELNNRGVENLIYTDIDRDGMLCGPNLEVLKKLNEMIDINLIAAGGVTTVEDLEKLSELNLYGAIVGKALYEGKISMEQIKNFQSRS